MASQKQQHITITASSGLSKEEIDKLVKDAQAHESEDKKRREEIEVRNTADALIYATEKTLKESREKLPVKIVNDVEAALEECKKAVKEENNDKMKSATDALMKASHKMAEELYKTTSPKEGKGDGPTPGGDGTDAGAKKDEEAVEAEFTEAKE